MADRLVVTKTDLADEPSLAALRKRLRNLNISAQILESSEIGGDVHRLLTDDIYDAAGKFREAGHWVAEEVGEHTPHTHTADVQSFAAVFDRPLDWTAFGVWASMLLHRHGADVLRLKGLLNVAGVPTPVLINGVQHIVHPPSHSKNGPMPTGARVSSSSCAGLQRARIERSLAVFNDLVNTSATSGRASGPLNERTVRLGKSLNAPAAARFADASRCASARTT